MIENLRLVFVRDPRSLGLVWDEPTVDGTTVERKRELDTDEYHAVADYIGIDRKYLELEDSA